MIASFRSELVKLFRRNTLLGYGAAAAGFTVLITAVSVLKADDPNASGPAHTSGLSLEELAEPGGFLAGFASANNFLGIVALALFASSIAAEFSTGTIRALLVTDSRRRSLLAGKVLGLTALLAAVMALAAVVGAVTSAVLAGPQGIDTSAWATLDGLGEGLATWATLVVTTTVWGLFGALIAMVSRSAAISIAAGIAYFLIGEQLILQSLWPSTADWLPAGLLNALAEGGTTSVTFTAALSLSALYGAAAYAITMVVFQRRDVTD